jgi:hypothetical protein
MMSSLAKVISGHACHATSAEDVSCAKATDASSTDVISTEAADVTTAEATHVASAKTTSMSSTAAAAAAAGLGIGGNKAAGKQRACQNHYHSSSHDILLRNGRTIRRRALSGAGVSLNGTRRRRDGLKMRMLFGPFH